MLRENQKVRPNIYQVVKEACAMLGRECPVKDVSHVIVQHPFLRICY
jgi:AP2-associated kinase